MTHALIDATERLADTLARENAALDALDVAGAAVLLPAKRTALAALAEADALSIPPEHRGLMADAVRRLQAVAAENRRLLQRALTVQGRVIEVIVGALPREEPAGRYTRPTAYARAPRSPAWSLAARV